MISFFYETEEIKLDEKKLNYWLSSVIDSEKKQEGEISVIFCDDAYLLEINQKFLNHDTYTDIISFDNTIGDELNGDVFISYERVKENASIYNTTVDEELRRVVVHGILHFCGFKDKTDLQKEEMRRKEDEKLLMFHVEH